MTTIKQSFTALKSSDRIQSLDIMRGIVLLGILLMNINGMGLAGGGIDPTVQMVLTVQMVPTVLMGLKEQMEVQ